MTVYLNERQVGFDTTCVGFPKLGACMGLVAVEAGGLYGFHMMPCDKDRIAGFITYYTSRLGLTPANWRHLYGSCYFPNRYAAVGYPDWKKEMDAVAQAIGYQGPISGFDTSIKSAKIDKDSDTYVEYRAVTGGTASIHYKRMAKMDYQDTGPAIGPGTDNIRHVVKSGTGYTTGTKTGFSIPTSVSVKRTRWNKGEIHQAAAGDIHTYNYP